MVTGPTFTIDGAEYPALWMKDFRFQDWALIRDITGLDAEAFVRLHNEDKDSDVDPLVLFGYAAVAYWRKHELLPRERMAAEAADWTPSMVTLAMPPKEGDAGPPAERDVGSEPTSSSEPSLSSDASSRSPDEPSE